MLPEYVKRIDLPTPYPVGAVSVYYFADADTVIDIGYYQRDSIKLLNDLGIKPEKTRVLATHGHDDHIGIAKQIRFSQLLLSKVDAQWLGYSYPGRRIVEKNLLMLGVPNIYMQQLIDMLERIFSHLRLPEYKPVSEGAVFELNGKTLITIGSAGHTPGSISYFLKSEGVLFAGDAVLADITSNPGTIFVVSSPLGIYDFNPIKNYLETLDKIEAVNPSLIAGSHGRFVRNPKERIRELRSSYIERIDKTYRMLKACPLSVYGVARKIFSNHKPSDDLLLQLCEAMSYLYYLKNIRLIVQDGLKWYAL